ncbi:Oidioi.mRNA.OKI2018_I69.XSR.g14635.t1.cds [Oikopleura dioica]|uniref:Oidioi.mRNA.OKI2018_I69.XSR.g14635.t1.cds n=1 Tax=Oikopleura dioica TaxID=34765 RepID=A0ABN7SGQ0_OIKDI|nr:Oidioi.mRNA.OKI2018_I69.XSR.g14635.t1.cds [Oikopleura dioica]
MGDQSIKKLKLNDNTENSSDEEKPKFRFGIPSSPPNEPSLFTGKIPEGISEEEPEQNDSPKEENHSEQLDTSATDSDLDFTRSEDDPSPIMSPLLTDLEYELKNSVHASTPIYDNKENNPPDFNVGYAPHDFGTQEELDDITKVLPHWKMMNIDYKRFLLAEIRYVLAWFTVENCKKRRSITKELLDQKLNI